MEGNECRSSEEEKESPIEERNKVLISWRESELMEEIDGGYAISRHSCRRVGKSDQCHTLILFCIILTLTLSITTSHCNSTMMILIASAASSPSCN